MPTLINDWDSTKRQPNVVWGTKCTRCGSVVKADTPTLPKDWEEGKAPNADGRVIAQCPECGVDNA